LAAYYQAIQEDAADAFERYDFAGDAAFQQGLQTLLASPQAAANPEGETLLAKLFYFNRCAPRPPDGLVEGRRRLTPFHGPRILSAKKQVRGPAGLGRVRAVGPRRSRRAAHVCARGSPSTCARRYRPRHASGNGAALVYRAGR